MHTMQSDLLLRLDGSVHGYFKGKRGLRQGNPLSPYLFVIAMNCLSLMLNKSAEKRDFNYHLHCKETKLTHLYLADDLLIFMDGSLSSVQNGFQILSQFEDLSGLAINKEKTNFYTAGLTDHEINKITTTTGLCHRTLPIRYLGLPLCTKKLTMLNCVSLIQKVKSKMSFYTARSLSYPERLQLLKFVISRISNLWCSAFILPKRCISTINSLFGLFLWKGNIESHHIANVSWDSVTNRKDEGGLGLPNLLCWNNACSLKLVWMLFFKSGSIWVAWVTRMIFSGNLGKCWTIKANQKYSWLINKLIKLRETIYPWIKLSIGNGKNCGFWVDNWSPFGSLSSFFEPEGPLQTWYPKARYSGQTMEKRELEFASCAIGKTS